jgi:phosphoglycerol transferase
MIVYKARFRNKIHGKNECICDGGYGKFMAIVMLIFILFNLKIILVSEKKRFLSVLGRMIGISVFWFTSAMYLCQWLQMGITKVIKLTPKQIFVVIAYGLVVTICHILYARYFLKKEKTFTTKGQLVVVIIAIVLLFIGLLLFFSTRWLKSHFGGVGIDEIMYTLSQPLSGSESSQVISYVTGPLLKAILYSMSLYFIFFKFYTYFEGKFHLNKMYHQKKMVFGCFGICSLIIGFVFAVHTMGYSQLKAYFFEKATVFEKYYVDPQKATITFPQKKRNLIYIYMESMESSYTSKENGGDESDNLIPNLTNIAENEGINFSNTNKLGGAQAVPGTGFTMGGMIAQTAGIPLKVSVSEGNNDGDKANAYGSADSYLPGAYSLGDILNTEGYNQTLLIGSDGSFSGKAKYFQQHGNYTIMDHNYAKEQGWIPSDYNVWWGYEDAKLFEYAKNQLTEMSSKSEPFNLTMLTADTHFQDGYSSSSTPDLYSSQYSNVIHYSDQMVGELVKWIQEQSFYDNTTIVISGDHLTMQTGYFADDSKYTRTVFNTILNSAVDPKKYKKRAFTTMDMYPTTLASLGVEISGNRLGLGTNLFSSRKTLAEQLGFQNFYDELSKKSDYFEKYILQGSDKKVKKAMSTNSSN